jgi:hypothetical protein
LLFAATAISRPGLVEDAGLIRILDFLRALNSVQLISIHHFFSLDSTSWQDFCS